MAEPVWVEVGLSTVVVMLSAETVEARSLVEVGSEEAVDRTGLLATAGNNLMASTPLVDQASVLVGPLVLGGVGTTGGVVGCGGRQENHTRGCSALVAGTGSTVIRTRLVVEVQLAVAARMPGSRLAGVQTAFEHLESGTVVAVR